MRSIRQAPPRVVLECHGAVMFVLRIFPIPGRHPIHPFRYDWGGEFDMPVPFVSMNVEDLVHARQFYEAHLLLHETMAREAFGEMEEHLR